MIKTFENCSRRTMRYCWFANGANIVIANAVEKAISGAHAKRKHAANPTWVKLGVTRARQSDTPACFWLEKIVLTINQLRNKVENNLKVPRHKWSRHRIILFTTERFDFFWQRHPFVAKNTYFSYRYILSWLNLNDLFPILELGTSAKMLSIVPKCLKVRHVWNGRWRFCS